MSREWQQTKLKKYVMPDTVYHQCLWTVRDLCRMEQRLSELDALEGSILCDQGQIVSQYEGRSREAKERQVLETRLEKIYDALQMVPPEFRYYIIQNVVFQKPGSGYPEDWRIWKQKFLYHVAKNFSMI